MGVKNTGNELGSLADTRHDCAMYRADPGAGGVDSREGEGGVSKGAGEGVSAVLRVFPWLKYNPRLIFKHAGQLVAWLY